MSKKDKFNIEEIEINFYNDADDPCNARLSEALDNEINKILTRWGGESLQLFKNYKKMVSSDEYYEDVITIFFDYITLNQPICKTLRLNLNVNDTIVIGNFIDIEQTFTSFKKEEDKPEDMKMLHMLYPVIAQALSRSQFEFVVVKKTWEARNHLEIHISPECHKLLHKNK